MIELEFSGELAFANEGSALLASIRLSKSFFPNALSILNLPGSPESNLSKMSLNRLCAGTTNEAIGLR